MKADWNDAPQRLRKPRNNKPFLVALVTIAGLVLTGAYVTGVMPAVIQSLERNDQRSTELNPFNPSVRADTTPQRSAAKDDDPYLQQVNRMLGITAEETSDQRAIEWAVQSKVESPVDRQTAFSDANYSPVKTVNTIHMPRPAAQSAPPQHRQQSYVTVVKETRESCGFYKPGSIECRRYRASAYRSYNRACLQSSDSQSVTCRLAKAHEPTR